MSKVVRQNSIQSQDTGFIEKRLIKIKAHYLSNHCNLEQLSY
jgi:hypothetical protein